MVRDNFALRFGLLTEEEWNKLYPDFAIKKDGKPKPEELRENAKYYEAVKFEVPETGRWFEGLYRWDGENVYAEVLEDLGPNRKSTDVYKYKLNKDPVGTRSQARQIIDATVQRAKISNNRVTRNISPDNFVKQPQA